MLLTALCLVLGLGGNWARELLRYDRDGLLSGELWRLITAHTVHLGWPHLSLNVIALIILGNLFADVLTRRQWWLGALLSAAAIDAGLLLLNKPVVWYVGLSGVLHGLILLGGMRLARGQPGMGLCLVIGVILKLGWEQWQGPLPFTASVLVDAHLYGALGGGVTCLVLWLHRRRKPPSV